DAISGNDPPRPRCTPLHCPDGTIPIGPGFHFACATDCEVSPACESEQQCAGGTYPCNETRFCIESREFRSGPADVFVGRCDANGACARGRCSIARRCSYPQPAEPDPEPQSSGCSIGARRGSIAALLGYSIVQIAVGRLMRRAKHSYTRKG